MPFLPNKKDSNHFHAKSEESACPPKLNGCHQFVSIHQDVSQAFISRNLVHIAKLDVSMFSGQNHPVSFVAKDMRSLSASHMDLFSSPFLIVFFKRSDDVAASIIQRTGVCYLSPTCRTRSSSYFPLIFYQKHWCDCVSCRLLLWNLTINMSSPQRNLCVAFLTKTQKVDTKQRCLEIWYYIFASPTWVSRLLYVVSLPIVKSVDIQSDRK
ncbi:unnamed protein product [Albugo candida]|uniref:Uncharacterized protein n=1 Tax=Albugo candida TaxID=65357 RepID=A0A024GUA2_9STRA|nr:unnamed protein product [Albugo candida]|eukprot:CCI50378.1 unnamed protein product [Albugo candida]